MHSSIEGVVVTKANGEREAFSPDKLFRSLVNSGASETLARTITRDIERELREGDKTKDIYKKAFVRLRKEERPVAARYSVKRALLDLGPSGYPFEMFLAEIYKKLGYSAETGVIVQGRCVEHELDVVATKGDERLAAEVKFHNNHGVKSDLKVALYVKARFDDIAAQSGEQSKTDFTDTLLITNTKFTKQVEIYAACVGLRLISWDYPAKGNLRELIEETRVHPVSCLTSLSKAMKHRLMEKGIVLCGQVQERMGELDAFGITEKTQKSLAKEIADLCA